MKTLTGKAYKNVLPPHSDFKQIPFWKLTPGLITRSAVERNNSASRAPSLESLAITLRVLEKETRIEGKRERRREKGEKYSNVMATKCTRHHPSRSFYSLALSRRAFSPGPRARRTQVAIKRLTNASRYLVSLPSSLPPPPSLPPSLDHHPHLPPQSGLFFAGFHAAQAGCNPATPIVARRAWKRARSLGRREWGVKGGNGGGRTDGRAGGRAGELLHL